MRSSARYSPGQATLPHPEGVGKPICHWDASLTLSSSLMSFGRAPPMGTRVPELPLYLGTCGGSVVLRLQSFSLKQMTVLCADTRALQLQL